MAQLKDSLITGDLRVTGTIYGNATTATKLQTARKINGTDFDGTADITTAKWGPSRTIGISSTAGNTGTTIDGSADKSLVIPSTMTGFTSITSTKFVGALQGNANTATKSGVSTIWLYPENGNELNIGGTNTNKTIYFGYTSKDSRPLPELYVFSGSSGTATIQAARLNFGGSNLYIDGTDYTGKAATAGTADKAVADGNNNNIVNTYATKNELNGLLSAQHAMIFKGVVNSNSELPTASSNPPLEVGWTYRVQTAGTYASQPCEVGDLLICVPGDTTGTTKWIVSQGNLDGVVIGPASATSGKFAAFDGGTGKLIKNTSYGPESFVHVDGSSTMTGTLKINTSGNTLTIGSQNASFTHFKSSADIPFYFNNGIQVDGYLIPYGTTNTKNLGSTSAYWKNAYITTVHGALDGNAKTATSANLTTTTQNAIAKYSNTTGQFANSGLTIDASNRLTMTDGAPINQVLIATSAELSASAVGSTGASGASDRYKPSRWAFSRNITVTNGDIFTLKIPVAGHANGVYLTLNGTNYFPVVLNGTGWLTTHYPVNTFITVVFESSGQANSIYPLNGGTAKSDVTGGAFRVINYFDSNTTYSTMSVAELQTGTATNARTMSAKNIKDALANLAGTGLALTWDATNGIVLNHDRSALSTGGTTGETGNSTALAFTVPYIVSDTEGHVMGTSGTRTITVQDGTSSQKGVVKLGTGSGDAAAGNHAHGNITNAGKISNHNSHAVVTDANGSITALDFTVATPTSAASGDVVAFISAVSQNSQGKISATLKNIRAASTSATGIVKLSSTSSSTENSLAATPAGVWAAINTLDVDETANTTGIYIKRIKQVDGKITATTATTSVSNTWTNGTTSGPTIKTTVNGVDGTAVAIPSASINYSGAVTTGTQSFAGVKTFENTTESGGSSSGAVVIKGGLGVSKTVTAKQFRVEESNGKVLMQYNTTTHSLDFVFGA